MERVVNVLRDISKNGDSEVKDIISEDSIMNEKVNVKQLEFTICEPISKVNFLILVKFRGTRSF